MLRLASYDIVFQEVPGEVTLALNISGCPNRCVGCHSPHLREDVGEMLDDAMLEGLISRYGEAVTCVCFMGGDADPGEVARLAAVVRRAMAGRLKTGWYSGKNALPQGCSIGDFDYIKLGPYIAGLGGLDSAMTNQRFYHVKDGKMIDATHSFRRTIAPNKNPV